MANAKISQLPAVTSVNGADLGVVVQGGATSQVTIDNLFKNRTMVAPTLGVASATSVNKVAITAPATSATLTIADGKTATVNNSITFAGTDSTTMTFPGTSATIARTDAANSFTGNQTIGGAVITTPDTRTGPGAVSITTTTTAFVSTGTGDALTLADGTAGQIKTIVYTAEAAGADTGVLTPANRIGYATITFNDIGDSATLQFIGTGWAILALYGAVKA